MIVITDHDGYDWTWISNNAQLIVDTRNAIAGSPNDHIFRL